jgi:uncharacterized protein (TIGR02453 family)
MTGASFFSVSHQKGGKAQTDPSATWGPNRLPLVAPSVLDVNPGRGRLYNVLENSTEELPVASSFLGFKAESFAFFQDLSQHNNKTWFDQNRTRYEEHVTGTFRGLLETLTPFLLELNPQFETSGKTNGNFSRINRDIRFSKDKSPYKPNYYLYVYDRRHDRGHAGRLYVGLSADCVTVGFSIYDTWRGPKGALQTVFRRRLMEERELFQKLLADSVRAKHYETYWHRQEGGEWVQHPGLPRRDADWQSLQAWIVRKAYLPNSRAVAEPAFAGHVERVFKDLYPLYVFTSELGFHRDRGASSPRGKLKIKSSQGNRN